MPAENADLILRYLVSIDKQLDRNFARLRQLQSLRQSGARDARVGSPTEQVPTKSQAQTIPSVSGIQQSQLRVFRVQGAGDVV